MSTGLVEVIKRAALEAVDNSKMCDLRYGTVVNTSPLKVRVANNFTIPNSLLVVPEHLTDHTLNVTVDFATHSDGTHKHTYDEKDTSENGSHTHIINGKTTVTIHNALKVGDKVALLRKQGGQSYFILDKIRGD